MSQPNSYPKSKVLALCAELGEDPDKVSQIVISPNWITVEHTHPISDDVSTMNVAFPISGEVNE
jgi:hypothetical protein